MMNGLRKIYSKFNVSLGLMFLVSLAGAAIRLYSLPFVTRDSQDFIQWFTFIQAHEGIKALAYPFAEYAPGYLFLLAAVSYLTPASAPALTVIKSIPIIFDFIASFLSYAIVKRKYQSGLLPVLAYTAVLLAPTVILNSSVWGQCDSIYVTFLLVTVFAMIEGKPILAAIAFGLAFSFKPQAVVLFPWLIMLFIKQRFPWYGFAFIPLPYVLLSLPAVVVGRPLNDVFSTYSQLYETFPLPTLNAANPYVFALFMPPALYPLVINVGIGVTAGTVGMMLLRAYKSQNVLTPSSMIGFATVFTGLLPFLLPKMHERYFFPADVLSIVLAFYIPSLWFISVIYQIISILTYLNFIASFDVTRLLLSTILNFPMVIILLKYYVSQWSLPVKSSEI